MGDLSRRLVAEVDNLDISQRQVEWLTLDMGYLGTEAKAHVSASVSDRITALADGIERTSGLGTEWQRARAALEHARQYAAFVGADANYHNQMAVEVLLLIFGTASLASVFLQLPLSSWSAFEHQARAVMALITLLVLGVTLIVRRRR